MRRVPSRSAATVSRGEEEDVTPLHSVIGGKLRFSFGVAISVTAVTAVVSISFLCNNREREK